MIINVDMRENELYSLLKDKISQSFQHIQLNKQMLPLGDITICNPPSNELLIIERKTINDLASSIKDGRYTEQSFRLNNCNTHNHSIIYLIEGDFRLYKQKKFKLNEKTLQTSLFSLNYYKGFSVHRTVHLNETAQFILLIADKLSRSQNQHSFYFDISNNLQKKYCEVVKKTKKSNITIENIGEIILTQIPSVSSATATAIMHKYKNIKTLIQCNPEELKEIKITTKSKKKRRISKRSVENIVKYLIQ